ncbi:NAD-dependent epimerase/dehydratase family protein [Candidatus Nephthysia bennettiae]|uniref:NAD-dependent epimerase/dehydratase family protein n=1 Tax=Candidatus Nephthysia bennettiae TaxID=3127016 RepID=A0A934K3G1_9BACT|nr:NAD-dependent epimerase/dehydratase family protein [Candidatus Dormibacteraeota bacterium]MBJ7613293.1 NAD-dependent epimerase/dehydratase family protein [Candidatus Dormibacteraeota bacterium]
MTETAATPSSGLQNQADSARIVFVTGGSGFLGRRLIPALLSKGYRVKAMARSDGSAALVGQLGAAAVRCDLADSAALTTVLQGCDLVVHAAGRFREGGGYAEYVRDNVTGTQNMLIAAKAAGVRRFTYVGAAGCLVGGKPVQDADESWPLQEPTFSPYFRTKTIADHAVRAANSPGFATCVVRPGLIWGGEGDVFTESIAEATRAGKMVFIDRGRHRIVTSHVDNTVQGILLALEKGADGEAYFVFDDGTVQTRDFLTRLLRVRGLQTPDRSIPVGMAWIIASLMEAAWKVLRRSGTPPVNRELVKLNGGPFVVSDRKARIALGYVPLISRDSAIETMARSAAAS